MRAGSFPHLPVTRSGRAGRSSRVRTSGPRGRAPAVKGDRQLAHLASPPLPRCASGQAQPRFQVDRMLVGGDARCVHGVWQWQLALLPRGPPTRARHRFDRVIRSPGPGPRETLGGGGSVPRPESAQTCPGLTSPRCAAFTSLRRAVPAGEPARAELGPAGRHRPCKSGRPRARRCEGCGYAAPGVRIIVRAGDSHHVHPRQEQVDEARVSWPLRWASSP